ncbi:glucosamine inositolphosphorylceramide transferase family protein [Sphingobium mellinum]|uniref:glucosamine inositolphosphorylceramide transferase family protein n=1 Tax=Sphingobium mellinum TaxID=1387166 RepID=UPI0030ED6BD3
MPRRKDIWKSGLVAQPLPAIIAAGGISDPVTWIAPEPDFQFLADPFGWRDDQSRLHVFAEHYDYRTRHGTIHRLLFDDDMRLIGRQPCLVEPWHLSYPQVFAGEGATWMLPEAYRSGALTLYRDHGGLADWRAECRIALDCVPVDASILRHEGRWWLFYSPATTRLTKIAHLHVAWADRLCGPWRAHPGNPVRIDRRSTRPGGTPTVIDGRIMLPVQDCAATYGGAIRPLWIDRLDEAAFVAEAGDGLRLPASANGFDRGMHTLAACGDVTLFDVKRIDRSLRGLMLDVRRGLGGFR